MGQRFGFLEEDGGTQHGHVMRIWLHGASVGEVQLARVLINELAEILPEADFVLSTMTEQGMEVARKQVGAKARCIYAPLDLAGIVGRAIRKIRPTLYICLETELWPAFLFKAKSSGVKLILLNGRLSERSLQRYNLAKGFMTEILSCFSMIAVIQETDAQRYMSLGADPEKIRVLGNAKYDQDMDGLALASAEQYRTWLNLQPGQPVFVAGSTHTGEEEMLLKVFQDLQKVHGLQDLIWVLAPRHLQRLPEVETLLHNRQVPFERLHDVKESQRRSQTILVDTMGDLAGLYAIATFVFCGGSLVERGGHNIMEAAIFGKPVFYGPSMKDFSDAAELLEAAGGGFPVSGPAALAESIVYFWHHPEEYEAAAKRAQETAASQQGAARKQAELVKDIFSH
ncbi:MAG: glycosyltransferase N-terminal domain-containing protein [Desulfobulbales bacterium]|nr:glycosyltransferase N-terminal domain-containing protein [Desulfobulbales bacterium]